MSTRAGETGGVSLSGSEGVSGRGPPHTIAGYHRATIALEGAHGKESKGRTGRSWLRIPSYIVEYFLLGQTRKGAVERFTARRRDRHRCLARVRHDMFALLRVLVAPNDGVRTVDLGYALHKGITAYRNSLPAGESRVGISADRMPLNVSPLENCVAVSDLSRRASARCASAYALVEREEFASGLRASAMDPGLRPCARSWNAPSESGSGGTTKVVWRMFAIRCRRATPTARQRSPAKISATASSRRLQSRR